MRTRHHALAADPDRDRVISPTGAERSLHRGLHRPRGPVAGAPLASLVHRRSHRSRKSSCFDLNLPYSRAVEMYMRSGMPTLDFGSRAEAARRITKPGRAWRLTGGYPE